MVANMKQVNDGYYVGLVQEQFVETELTLQQIAEELELSVHTVVEIVNRHYTAEQRRNRKRRMYANSKLGTKNPMLGKTGELHHRYKGVVADGNGYFMVPKPEWYTGRKGSKHVFQHTIVMCLALGLTELPPGFVVHHIDGDKTNNDIHNLALVTIAGHGKIHAMERATTIPEGSTQATVEAQGTRRPF